MEYFTGRVTRSVAKYAYAQHTANSDYVCIITLRRPRYKRKTRTRTREIYVFPCKGRSFMPLVYACKFCTACNGQYKKQFIFPSLGSVRTQAAEARTRIATKGIANMDESMSWRMLQPIGFWLLLVIGGRRFRAASGCRLWPDGEVDGRPNRLYVHKVGLGLATRAIASALMDPV